MRVELSLVVSVGYDDQFIDPCVPHLVITSPDPGGFVRDQDNSAVRRPKAFAGALGRLSLAPQLPDLGEETGRTFRTNQPSGRGRPYIVVSVSPPPPNKPNPNPTPVSLWNKMAP